MSLGSFQTRNGLQFILYKGPQPPKLTSRRGLSKMMPSNEHEYLRLDGNLSTGPALTSHQAENVDLASLAGENICELDSYDCGCRDLDSEDGFLPQNRHQNVGVEHFIPGRTSRGTSFEGSSHEYAVVIEDSQPESDATTHQSQRGVHKMAVGQGKYDTFRNTSSSNSSNGSDSNTDTGDADDDNDRANGTELTRKRKRSPPAKQHSLTSSTTSQRRPIHSAHSAGQRKPFSLGRPLANHLSSPKPRSAAQYSGYDTTICYSDDSSDDSSEESSDCGRHLGSNKRPKSTSRAHRSSTETSNNSNENEENEYEVERILDARLNCSTLQYRAKWLGYKHDPQWYDASNFKNSPYKLRDFHQANPTYAGPPVRLEVDTVLGGGEGCGRPP